MFKGAVTPKMHGLGRRRHPARRDAAGVTAAAGPPPRWLNPRALLCQRAAAAGP
jgi:hypothetical protein